jgi:hypothetical protein
MISTDSKGICTAKPLSFTEKSEVPVVTLKNASKELRKDVWIMKVKGHSHEDHHSESNGDSGTE